MTEDKEWLISRLDILYNVVKDELLLSKESFTEDRKEEVAKVTGRRNNILSAVVVVIGVLTILSETKWIERELVLEILIADIVFGLITFYIANRFVTQISNAYIYIENSVAFALKNFNHNYGFLMKETFSRSSVTSETLQNYKDFMINLSAILLIPMIDALASGSSYRLIHPLTKSYFATSANELKNQVDKAISSFNTMNKQQLPQELLTQVTDAISAYNSGKFCQVKEI